MAATHYGICQACGAQQKLPNGSLSNHGYTVSWGFFQGTCAGSKKAPFEESCDLVEQFIENAENTKKDFQKQIEELKKNTGTKSVYHHYVSGRGGGYRIWKECQVVDGDVVYTVEKEYKVSGLRLSLHGTDEEIARKLDGMKIKWIERQIKEVEKYIGWQKERIKDWKPRPLEPIKGKQ